MRMFAVATTGCCGRSTRNRCPTALVGGYLAPEETEAEIGKRLAALSPIRSIASVRKVSGAVLKKPFAINGPAVGWVGETAARQHTATATLAELQFPTMELL